jgi:hypothetical protein
MPSVDTEVVTGSSPVSPTSVFAGRKANRQDRLGRERLFVPPGMSVVESTRPASVRASVPYARRRPLPCHVVEEAEEVSVQATLARAVLPRLPGSSWPECRRISATRQSVRLEPLGADHPTCRNRRTREGSRRPRQRARRRHLLEPADVSRTPVSNSPRRSDL